MRTHSLLSKADYGEDEFIEIDGYQLHYVEVGKGKPVLLIPGSFSTYRVWNAIIPRLSEEYRLLALDYLGTGNSDKPRSGFRYTIGEQADLAARLIRKMRLGKTHLIGAAYGGAIVLDVAARFPEIVGKVASIEGSILKPKALPANPIENLMRYPILGDAAIAIIRSGAVNPMILRRITGEWYPKLTTDQKLRFLEDITCAARSASRIAWYWIGRSPQNVIPFEEEAKRIQSPILYLAGEKSVYRAMAEENIRFLRENHPQAKIVEFSDGIHDLALQKPREVAQEILEFFAKGY